MSSFLSIIIVNYKTPDLLLNCIGSIYAQTHIDFEVIVVDNNSLDNSRELILAHYTNVRWIQMPYNAGFARANNEGIRQSNGAIVLLLNSDTVITNNAIENTYQLFNQSPYVACGVQLLNEDGTPQISGNYFMKGGINHLLPLPFIGSFLRWLGILVNVKKPNIPDAQSIIEVDWINGAFLMVKKTAIKQAGLMDEDFFLYAEEAEWCSRLAKEGKLCIYGQCKVIHLQGGTSNDAFNSSGKGYYNLFDRKGLQIMLSNFVRIRKQYGIGWFLFHLLMYTLAIPVYFAGSFIWNLLRLKNPVADFNQAFSMTMNVGRIWGYLPIILSNRAYFYKAFRK